ncbi:hypothetical protein GF357_00575 [Candidatus Dojkabacteria bacterium]|nr:hypothetical protein [Candidatus Dojkabacteria bacterium]
MPIDKEMKKWISLFVKATIAIVGLFLVYRNVDFQAFSLSITWENAGYFIGALISSLIAEMFAVFRFRAIANNELKIWSFIKINIIGKFFNMFLPTSVGGDFMRAAKLGKYTKENGRAVLTTFIDRLIGITVVAFLACLTCLVLLITGEFFIPVVGSIAILVLSIVVLIAWLMIIVPKFEFLFRSFSKVIPISSVRKFVDEVINSLGCIRRLPIKRIAFGLIYSLGVQFFSSILVYLLSYILDLNINLFHIIIFRSISDLLLLIPLSINGLGVRDYIYKYFYGSVTSSPNVVLLSPMVFLVMTIQGIIGGALYVIDSKDGD